MNNGVYGICAADLIAALDVSLLRPDNAMTGVKRFQELTHLLYLQSDIAATWYEKQVKAELIQDEFLNSFNDRCSLVLSRYEETHPFMIKGLCQLCVVGGMLGRMATAIVAEYCAGTKKQDYINIVLEVISPLLDVIANLPPQLQFNVMSSLTLLPCIPEFSGALQPLVHNIIADIIRDPWRTEYMSLLETVCLDEDNGYDVMYYGLADHIMGSLTKYVHERGPLHHEGADLKRLCDLMNIIGITIRGSNVTKMLQFFDEVVIPTLKFLIGEREGTSRLTPQQSRLCSVSMRLCVSSFDTGKQTFDELCFGYHIFDLFLVPVKEPMADPLVLATALHGILAIIANRETGDTFATAFTEEVDIALLLAYLRPERLKRLAEASTGDAKDLVCSIAKFIGYMLSLSASNPRVYEFTEKMFEKGLAIMVLDAIASRAVDREINKALVYALSRFSVDKIDSSAITIMLELMTTSNVLEFQPDIFEYMVSAMEQKLGMYPMEPIIEKVCWLLVVTLKTVNARQYQGVHLSCVSLLLTVSRTNTGKMLLKEKNNSLSIMKALKYEQEFCAYDHADVCVERTWIGKHVSFLNACMFDTFRLRHDHRQIFRVLYALGEALLDDANGKEENRFPTIDVICTNEIKDFADEGLHGHVAFIDEESDKPPETNDTAKDPKEHVLHISLNKAEGEVGETQLQPPSEFSASVHRDQQRQIFISMDMTKKIMSYLSGSFSPGFTEHYQYERKCKAHSEYWAGLLKGRKLDCETAKRVDSFDWAIKCSKVFDEGRMPEDAVVGDVFSHGVCKPASQMITYLIGKKLETSVIYHDRDDPFFRVAPTQLLHKIWLNESNGMINPCFTVSAYMRILYGLMSSSVSCVVSDVIRGHFRQPEFIRNLIKLTGCSTFLDANIAAKFFKLCHRALLIDASVQAESMDMIIVYDIISRFAWGVCEPLQNMVSGVSKNWVEHKMRHVHLVLLYLLRLLALFAKQTAWIKFSNILEIQEHFVEECIQRFIPENVLAFTMQVLFHIVSLETSSSLGTYVSHLCHSELLEMIRECCLELAVEASSSARNTYYRYVINMVSKHRNMNSLLLRPSLVSDLLRRVHLTEVRKAFQEYVSKKRLERVLIFDDVWTPKKDGSTKDKLMAVTSRGVHFLNVRDDDTFKVTRSYRSHTLCSIDRGLLYLIYASKVENVKPSNISDIDWVVFAMRHTAPSHFARFVTEDCEDILRQCASNMMDGLPSYMGICQCDDGIHIIAITKAKMFMFSVKPYILVECILKGEVGEEEEKPGNTDEAKSSEAGESSADESQTDDSTEDQPLELYYDCLCDSIKKVIYDKEPAVTLHINNGEDEDAFTVTFVSDSQRESFKRSLALAIGHLSWYRRWE